MKHRNITKIVGALWLVLTLLLPLSGLAEDDDDLLIERIDCGR